MSDCARDQNTGRDHAAEHVGDDGGCRLLRPLQGDEARHARKRSRRASSPSGCTTSVPSTSKRVNAISGERCSPHPHVFSDRVLRPGDPVYYDILHSYMGYRTCYYRTFCVGSASRAMVDAYKRCRDYLDASIELIRPGRTTAEVASVWPTCAGVRLPERGSGVCAADGPRHRPGDLGAADDQPTRVARASARDQARDGVRARDVLAVNRRLERRPDRGRNRRHANRPRGDHAVSRRGAARRRSAVRHGRWDAADRPRDRGAAGIRRSSR